MDFYLSYFNKVDYVVIVFLMVSFILYIVGFFIFLKLDISAQRTLAKKEGFKITSNYVILEYEMEELGNEGKRLNQSEDNDDMSESDLMSDSMSRSNSMANSKMGMSNNIQAESALNFEESEAEHKIIHSKKDSLEDFMENYELELDEKIRENQKASVEKEFGEKLFNNEDEQREILRNKKITLWDKVFAEFSDDESNKNRLDILFDNVFITFFALSLPSLKNPLMRTKWMPFIVHNCVLLTIVGLQLIFHFHMETYQYFIVSILISTLITVLHHYKVYDYTVHRYICCFLTSLLGYICVIDLSFVITDTIIFFIFYFRFDILMVIGGNRVIRYLLPSAYLVMQLCKSQRYMIAILFSFLFSVGTYTIIVCKSLYGSIVEMTTVYNGFIKTISLYNKEAVSLLFLGTTFMYFYIILMSFLMVIKKFKFDMSLMLLNILLFCVFIYSVVI